MIKALGELDELVGKKNIAVTSAFIGQHPSLFSTSPIYLFISVPQEAVVQVQIHEEYEESMEKLKEKVGAKLRIIMPDVKLSFEPIQLTDKILSRSSPTPIEVRLSGRNKKLNEAYAHKVSEKLKAMPYTRDV